MSTRKAGKTRDARAQRNRLKRQQEKLDFYRTHGMPEHMVTPRNLLKQQVNKAKQKKALDAFNQLLGKAKLVAIQTQDFDYCSLTAVDQAAMDLFNKGLRDKLAKFEGTEEPDAALDDCAKDHLQSMVDGKYFVPARPRFGAIPKARKFKSGDVQILRRGDPDYELLVKALAA